MRRGFSLLEALLAIALFSIVALLFLSTLTLGQEGSLVAGERSKALALASEGIEAVRNMRDAAFSNLPDADTYALVASSTGWQLATSSTDSIDGYTRSVEITDVSSTIKDIAVTVSWKHTFGRDESVTLVTRLTDWRRLVNDQVFRVTEYHVTTADFTNTTYTLDLDNPLASDYFVIVQGADGNASSNGNTGPDENYVALTSDPYGTGDLGFSATSTELGFTRNGDVYGWQGVITVVECLTDCTQAGFQLRDVARVTHTGSTTSGSDTFGTGWSNINQTLLIGGFNGAGCNTPETSNADHKVCHVRLTPSSTSTVDWTRNSGGVTLTTAYSTVMAVEWGSEWTVQRANPSGNNGGGGADNTGEYNTDSITSVRRDDTWVWGTGHTNDQGIGDAAEGVLITLGDGVNLNTFENEVAVGIEYNNNSLDFDVYTMTHEDLEVDYAFKTDGDSGSVIYDVPIATTSNTTGRMALITNGQNGTGNAYPRPLFSARYLDDNTVRAERRRSGQNWPAWIQGIDFSGIEPAPPDTTVPDAVSDLSLVVTGTSTLDLNWTAPGDDGSIGTATTYDVRYATTPITIGNWGSATEVAGEPAPSIAGSSESMSVSGLTASTTYYFAMRTSDEVPNESDLSNVSSTTTEALTEAERLVVDTSGVSVGGTGSRYVYGITLENTDAYAITVTDMTVSWSGVAGNRRLREITLDAGSVWTGNSSSPVNANITDTVIAGSTTIDLDELRYSHSVTGITISIDFTMSDGSVKSVTGISP